MASLGSSLIRGLLVMFLALHGTWWRETPSRHKADTSMTAAPGKHFHTSSAPTQHCPLSTTFSARLQLRLHHLLAYLKVLMVSSKFQSAGPMFATITVLVLPPRLSCKRRVSLESLEGTHGQEATQ